MEAYPPLEMYSAASPELDMLPRSDAPMSPADMEVGGAPNYAADGTTTSRSGRAIKRKTFEDTADEEEEESAYMKIPKTEFAPIRHREPKRQSSSKPVGAFTQQDDVLLKESVQAFSTIGQVAQAVKFSSRFNAQQLLQRWKELLYDEGVASEASKALAASSTNPKRVLWTPEEDQILREQTGSSSFSGFQSLLEKYRERFHSSRTPKSLEAHYYRIKKTITGETPEGGSIPATTDSTEMPDEAATTTTQSAATAPTHTTTPTPLDSTTSATSDVTAPIETEKDGSKTEMATTQGVGGVTSEKQVSQPLAVVRGKNLEYAMYKTSISLGRSTSSQRVDVDLSEEGTISRNTAVLWLGRDGDLYLHNTSHKTLLVNEIQLTPGKQRRLLHASLLEVGGVRVSIEPNQELLLQIREALLLS